MEYVELHCHSCYSLREGASTPRELIVRALQLGYRALALTDHDGVYGSMAFSKDANDAGFKTISGAEITLANGHHLTLLVKDHAGWSNLCQLLTHAYTGHGTKDEPRVELDERIHAAVVAGHIIALKLDIKVVGAEVVAIHDGGFECIAFLASLHQAGHLALLAA